MERVPDGRASRVRVSADFDPEPAPIGEPGALAAREAAAPAPAFAPPLLASPSARRSRARRAAILANMEMWRWEPRDMGERRIEVNVADFSVAALEGDEVILKARVIVGKPQTPTPIFSDVMRYVLINPSWQVPNSIIKKEMPAEARLS